MDKIRERLLSLADQGYRDFTLPLLPGIDEETFIGIRIPLIRKVAKELSEIEKSAFLDDLPHRYHEENILHALLISDIKDFGLFVQRADAFLPYVTNWSVCDTICNKHLTRHRDELLPVVYMWLNSTETYRVRYAVKCLTNYYLGEDFDEAYLRKVAEVHLEDYYVKMMVAWYLATGLAKNYPSFVRVIEERRFDAFTHNKAIQKAVESYRVSDVHKTYLKTLKVKERPL